MTLSKGGSRYSRKHHGHAGRKHHSKKHHSKKHRAGKHRTRKHHSRKHRRSTRVAGMRTSMNTLSDRPSRRSRRITKPSLKARENNPDLQRKYDSMTRKEREEKEKRRALLRATKKTKKTRTTKKKTGNPQGLSKATKATIAKAVNALAPPPLTQFTPGSLDPNPDFLRGFEIKDDQLTDLTDMMGSAFVSSPRRPARPLQTQARVNDPTIGRLGNMIGRMHVTRPPTPIPDDSPHGAPAPRRP